MTQLVNYQEASVAEKMAGYSGPVTIDLLNPDYQSKSIDQNQSRLINMYLEADQAKGKYSVVAYPTAGLTAFCDTTQANVRALLEHNEVLYAVAGNKFYSINSAGTKTERGTLNTSTGFAKMVVITGGIDTNNQIVIIDGTNGYHYNIGTAVATFPISDADFPQTAIDITNQDDYVIVLAADSISFYLSAVSDGLSYAALDFGSKTGFADRIAAIASSQRKLYLMGSKTIEPWYDGDNGFERTPDIFIQHGVASKQSVAAYGESIIFLGKSQCGGYQVFLLQGYQLQPIGGPAQDYQIAQMTTKSDAIGYCYMKDGHNFYDLTFPTDNITITYDLTVQTQVTRQSYISGTYGRFLGNCSAFCYDKSLIGDFNSGVIYSQHTNVYTENGTAIRRMVVTPPVYFSGRRIFIHKLEIDVETNIGASKTFTIEKSVDDGRNWTTINTFTVGSDNNTRLYANGLGSAKSWMFRVTSTMNANFIILGFIAYAEIGNY